MSTVYGLVMGVDINGGKTPMFLRVDHAIIIPDTTLLVTRGRLALEALG